MAAANRPATLVEGWRGAWGLNVRRALVAIRDQGPLSLGEVARVMRETALHADLTSGHNLGPGAGAEMLARAVLEDAAATVTVDPDGRYSVPADLTSFTSPYTGETVKLLTVDEQAAGKAKADAERPVRRWMSQNVYSPFGGKWTDGRLPHRRHTADEVIAMAEQIEAFGWLPGARIVKDQNGVTIEGHLRADALGLLSIDPDTGTDPRSGEPYVEIASFNNDAARLYYALQANWSTLKADTLKAIAHQVLGISAGAAKGSDVTLEVVATVVRPLADLMASGRVRDDAADPEPPAAVTAVRRVSKAPKTLNEDDLNLINQVGMHGYQGATSKELDAEVGVPSGATTGRLSRLADGGHLVVLAEKRDRCQVYVTPQWVADRPLGKRRNDGAEAETAVKPLPAEFTNEKVAAMTWREAAGPQFVNQHGKGRMWAASMPSADAPVADHVDAIIADLSVKLPWLLPMICDRITRS